MINICFVVINIILLSITCHNCNANHISYDSCLNLVDDCDAKPNSSSIDNSFAFKFCQGKLATNGGCIFVPNGLYPVFDIHLNTSNIIYYMDEKVTFIPYLSNDIHNKSYPVFTLGSSTSFVKNVSMIGSSSSNKFVIDLRNNVFSPWNIRGITCLGIDGFMLSNIDIKISANLSDEKSAIEFDHNNVNNVIYHAKNGKVINITASDYIYGYGLTQVQSAENIYFENLDGTGGVTLRLETGAGNQDGYVGNITGNNIICRNGHATVYSEPHTQKNGFFNVSNLISYSCFVGYDWGAGYSQNGKPPGYFTNGSIVDNVKSYYGTSAQVDKSGIGKPSCGPCYAGNTKNALNYMVDVSGLMSINFPQPSDRNSCLQWNPWDYENNCYWDNKNH